MNLQLVEMNIDGTEGRIYNIDHDNVIIGRDKSCNIRIKLPSISRQHAKIAFDENRNAILSHLSTTNPSFINAKKTEKATVLNHGDLLAFGDRIFMFKNLQNQINSAKSTLGSICESNESLVEPDVKENQDINTKKSLSTPLKKKIESLRKPETPRDSLQLKAKSPKPVVNVSRSLPTPLRNGIQLKRREYDNETNLPSQVNEHPAEKVKNQEKRTLPTPLRKQILSKQVIEQKGETKVQKAEVPPVQKKLNFSLQEAIVAKKKTLKQVNNSFASNKVTARDPSPVKEAPKFSLVPTPLRKAIALRREKVEMAMKDTEKVKCDNKITIQDHESKIIREKTVSEENPLMMDVRKTLFSPLKSEIVKRRKSLKINSETKPIVQEQQEISQQSAVDLKAKEVEIKIEEKVFSPVVEKVAIAIAETLNSPLNYSSPKKGLATPLRKAIQARRVSFGVKQTLEFLKDSSVDSQKDPVYLESLDLSPPQKIDSTLSENQSYVEEIQNSVEEHQSPMANKNSPMVVNQSPVQAVQSPMVAIQSPVQSQMVVNQSPIVNTENEFNNLMTNTQQLFTDILNAQSLQISTDIIRHDEDQFSTEHVSSDYESPKVLNSEIQVPSAADNVAQLLSEKKSFQCLFSPITPGNERAKVNILRSIEKKSRIQYQNIVSSMVTNRESFLTDIVTQLNDLDMEIIESYTQKLLAVTSKSVLDENDAFGIVLDAYIRGIECLVKEDTQNQKISQRLVFEDSHTSDDVELEHENGENCQESNQEMNDEDYVTENLSGLQSLFKLPKNYLDACSDAYDEELVETYAEELCITAGVSSPVAYGIALDSFLADPVKFRHFIGRLELPNNQRIHYLVSESSSTDVKETAVEVETILEEEQMKVDYSHADNQSENVQEEEIALMQQRESELVSISQEMIPADPISGNESSDIIEIPINCFRESELANPSTMEVAVQENKIEIINKTLCEVESTECAMEVDCNKNDEDKSLEKEENITFPAEEIPRIVSVEEPPLTPRNNNRKRKAENAKPQIQKVDIPAEESIQPRKKSKRTVEGKCEPEQREPQPELKSETEPDRQPEPEPEHEKPSKPTVKGGRGRSGKLEVPAIEKPKEEVVEVEEKRPSRSTRSSKKSAAEAVEAPKPASSTGKGSKGRSSKKPTKVEEEEKIEETEEIEEALAILCDKCDREYFVDEIGLKVIPKGKWFCNLCVSAEPKTRSRKK